MEKLEELFEIAKKLPHTPGVYIMKDLNDEIIYVGKAKNLKNRVSQYFNGRQKQVKVDAMSQNVYSFDFIQTNTESDAFALECNLIKKHMPRYNILLKDDKQYPYLVVNKKNEYPRFEITRRIKNDGRTYFGPFVTNMRVSNLLEIANEAFSLRTCKKVFPQKKACSRMCTNGDIGRCCGPCVGNISNVEYMEKINQACEFFKGKTSKVKILLKQKMNRFAQEQNFEKAIEIRDQIDKLEYVGNQTLTNLPKDLSIDCFAIFDGEIPVVLTLFVRGGKMIGQTIISLEGKTGTDEELLASAIAQSYKTKEELPKEIVIEKNISELLTTFFLNKFDKSPKIEVPKIGTKQKILQYANNNAQKYSIRNAEKLMAKKRSTEDALVELQEILCLPQKIWRIEGYDISNTSGILSVGSMVVFEGGEPNKTQYRKFKIKTVSGPNDFASLNEVLRRRLAKDEVFGKKPDLILIDGGLGQLHSAKKALDESLLAIPMISLAKKEELIFTTESNIPVVLNKNSEALRLLQRVRDESHRFAITFHKSLRDKNTFKTKKEG